MDIGGIVNEDAASAKRLIAADVQGTESPQAVSAGAKKLAAASSHAAGSKAPPPASAAAVKGPPRVDTRAKTPSTTFLTGGEGDGDDDELAKVSD